ncbi:MAG TPA: FtsX-like permease family protein [Streptosporangiaceae bacterium]|nr:FtsX-like permease family protein [Streptosporangiaceae bacterium]
MRSDSHARRTANATGPGVARGALPRFAWYRFRTTFRRRWGAYLSLAILIGLVGGVAMASMEAARRTDSSYPRFLAGTNPSDLVVQPFTSPAYSPGFVRQLAGLPHVAEAAVAVPLTAVTLTSSDHLGTVLLAHVQLAATVGGPDGLYSNQDRVTITAGRRPDPARADEVVATQGAAAQLHLHIGSRLPVGLIGSNTGGLRGRADLTVVGIGVLNTQVLQDSVDAGRTGFLLGTPALAREFAACCASGMNVGLRLDGGSRYDTAVGQEYNHLLATSSYISAGGSELYVYVTSAIEAEAQRSIRPEAIALGVFGLIAGFAALIIGTQSISRQLRVGTDDSGSLRALGAGPAMIMADGLPGVVAAVTTGALLAVGVAIALSPFSLFGPVREVEPGREIYLDGAVLGLGALGLILALGSVAAVIAYRQVPHRLAARDHAAGRRANMARTAMAAGLPVSGVEGLRLALEPGRGRTTVPVRSVLAGAVLAVTVVSATLTFGASLTTLVSHPALYGWDFGYALYAVQGWGPVPARWADPLLAHDPLVAASTGVDFATVQVDGQTVPAMIAPTRPSVAPHVLSGRGLDSSHDIVLGPATLAALHQRVGGTVTLHGGSLNVRLKIAGTATMPAIGGVLSVHPSMSTGVLFSTAVLPGKAVGSVFGRLLTGPNAILVRLRPGVGEAAGLRSMQAIRRQLTAVLNSPQALAASGGESIADSIDLLAAQRPAEIVNYKSMGAMPAVLAGGLAAGAVAGLGLTLVASVRRKRRDFATLKTLGFTRRQLAAAVAWQSSAIAAVGLVIGVPVGIAVGRWLWLAFAHELSAVPDPVVPAASIALAAAAALVLANLVAALPGRAAARTPAAVVLRVE